MNILLLEPFFAGSHRLWAEGLAKNSRHTIRTLSLPGRFWKWRMQGAAIHFAGACREIPERPDLILATDMLDAAAFRGLLRPDWRAIPLALYFHENQFAYPDADQDWTYAFINYRSALTAERVFFNSEWNRSSFFAGAEAFLKRMPDYRSTQLTGALRERTTVLPLGMDYTGIAPHQRNPGPPVILWNHRWEADKGILRFFSALKRLRDLPFQLLLLGERAQGSETLLQGLEDRILFAGHVPDRESYCRWLARADLLPVTTEQDFFGISVLEAVQAGVHPLLPERLAYPEHFPPHLFPDIYYRDNFPAALRKRLTSDTTQPEGLQERAARYQWERVIPLYDRLLEEAALLFL